MKRLDISRYAFSIWVATMLLAGCGGSQPPIGAPGVMPQGLAVAPAGTVVHRAGTSAYQVLYRFGGSPDGELPGASLIDVKGTFYGTTELGGAYCGGTTDELTGCGTVFSVATIGTENVLHSFGNGSDGIAPTANLIHVNGRLYGTTAFGGGYCEANGSAGCGTVFSITTTGKEKVLHRFGSGSDGLYPYAGLIDVNGTLYGTTAYGGAYGAEGEYSGTVFSITTTGQEKVLHSFGSGSDGLYPNAGLIDVNGTLYGTTSLGGAFGLGTVFSISTTGDEQVLHSFGAGRRRAPLDGRSPNGLAYAAGNLFGTTSEGGEYGDGTVFRISTTGKEHVLHTFGSGSDGRTPEASLVVVKGTLYGTTAGGGTYDDGTVFSITTKGTEQVLYSFAGKPSDGEDPSAGLIDVDGTLYGTTTAGGTWGQYFSYGTVFALSP
jgi:uncharacterized repeat protein (TIGR03803 family)